MKLNNGLLFSTVALALMATGCVKKQDNITTSGTYTTSTTNTTANGIYDTSNTSSTYDPSINTEITTTYDPSIGATTTLETAQPIIYENQTNIGGYSEIVPDTTVITTTNQGVNSGQIIDNYSDSYSSGAFSTGGGAENSTYSNPYPSYSGTDYSRANNNNNNNNNYSTSTAYSAPAISTSSIQSSGIHLQIAALKDYYAAEEFKNSLSLDPKYTAYIKRGSINKVIISGISSVNEANRLKKRRFPGAFIVRNSGRSSSSSSYSSAPAYSGSSYSGGGAYSDNGAYGGGYSSSSSSTSSRSASSGSVGVQIGAFSSHSKAQSIANANSGKYQAIVQQGRSRGKRIYRVILTGFSSRSDAKRALSSGRIANGFVTTVH
jgi:cell division septation protein DedD